MRRYAEIYAAYDEQCQREGVVDFAELLLRTYEVLVQERGAARALPEPLPAHPGGRVPGHQPPAVPLAEAARRPEERHVRGRRRRPEHLPLPRRERRQHGRVRARLPRRERDPPEQNYRSQGTSSHAANALIAHNKKRLGKNLWTAAGRGEPVRVYEAQSDGYEASWLAEEVQALKRDGLAPRRHRRAVPLERAVARSSSTRSSRAASPTASTAACASSSAWRSSTRSPTCASPPIPTTTARSCASRTFRRAASARARSRALQDAAKAGGIEPATRRRAGSRARPAPRSPPFVRIDRLAQGRDAGACRCPRRSR